MPRPMARTRADSRSDGSRSPSARTPRSIAPAMARRSLWRSGPGPSDHGPSTSTRSATVPLRREVALFGMGQFRDAGAMATTGFAPDIDQPAAPAFGATFAGRMGVAEFTGGTWSPPRLDPVAPLSLHPAAHVLHYGSACFEGLKAHRGVDGTVRIFRLDRHVARMQRSAHVLVLPVPPADLLTGMVNDTVRDALDLVPGAPGSLYLRPTLIGIDPNIGSAARPSDDALLFVLASPVGDYFAGGVRALVVAVSQEPRTTPQFGVVKSGANDAMALGATRRADRELGADQVLFAPGGRVEETGASNFVLLDRERLVDAGLDRLVPPRRHARLAAYGRGRPRLHRGGAHRHRRRARRLGSAPGRRGRPLRHRRGAVFGRPARPRRPAHRRRQRRSGAERRAPPRRPAGGPDGGPAGPRRVAHRRPRLTLLGPGPH